MSLTTLLPQVRDLPSAEKRELVAELLKDLGHPEADAPIAYQIWSPYDAFETAAKLQQFLKDSPKPEE